MTRINPIIGGTIRYNGIKYTIVDIEGTCINLESDEGKPLQLDYTQNHPFVEQGY